MRKLVVLAALALVGCGNSVEGVYTSNSGAFGDTIELKGGKMFIGAEGAGRISTDYKVEGDQVTIDDGGRSFTFKVDGNCLKGGGLVGDYCKK